MHWKFHLPTALNSFIEPHFFKTKVPYKEGIASTREIKDILDVNRHSLNSWALRGASVGTHLLLRVSQYFPELFCVPL